MTALRILFAALFVYAACRACGAAPCQAGQGRHGQGL